MIVHKLAKVARAALTPAYWPALRAGVVPTLEHRHMLRDLRPATVIDVGANKGQFTSFAASLWPAASMIAFEPIPGEAKRFRHAVGDRSQLHECALGVSEGQADLHVASRADSSSLLPLAKQAEVFSMQETAIISVKVRRLDEVLSAADVRAPALLKIDVQGFEYEVLRGATGLVPVIEWIFVEVSFVELYGGQKLFPEVTALLSDMGYVPMRRSEGARDGDGTLVQADILFQRQAA